MVRNRFDDAEINVGCILKGFKLKHMDIASLSDNYVLTVGHPPVIWADPAGGAKDILLPLASADTAGLVFVIVNTADAAENIVAKDSTDATSILTIGQNEIGILFSNGVTWRGITGVL